MKKYRVSIINWNIENNKERLKAISERYVEGIKNARAICPQLHYSRNANCWIAYQGNYEYVVSEVPYRRNY